LNINKKINKKNESKNNETKIQLFVTTLIKFLVIDIYEDSTIKTLKECMIDEVIAVDKQKLCFAGKQVEDYNIWKESVICLISRLGGSMYNETSDDNRNYRSFREIIFYVK